MRRIGVILIALLFFLGAGCKQQTDTTNNSSGMMSELEYYNLVIEQSNTIKANLDVYQEEYQMMMFNSGGECTYIRPDGVEEIHTTVHHNVIEKAPTMEEPEKQKKVEEKLTPYIESFAQLNEYAAEFETFCDTYTDSPDTQTKQREYEDGIVAKINEVISAQTDLFALVQEYQKEIDLGIDPNTEKPNEMAVLIQNTLTDQIEDLYEDDFTPFTQALIDGTDVDITQLEEPTSDLKKLVLEQEQRAHSVGLPADPTLKSAYAEYMESVEQVVIILETTIEDYQGGHVNADTITDYDDLMVEAYDAVIAHHNELVTVLETYPQ